MFAKKLKTESNRANWQILNHFGFLQSSWSRGTFVYNEKSAESWYIRTIFSGHLSIRTVRFQNLFFWTNSTVEHFLKIPAPGKSSSRVFTFFRPEFTSYANEIYFYFLAGFPIMKNLTYFPIWKKMEGVWKNRKLSQDEFYF